MNTRQMSDGSVLHQLGGAAMQFHELGRGVILHVCTGPSPVEFAPLVIAHAEKQLKAVGRCVVMVDAYDSKMMTTAFREKMTEWYRTHREERKVVTHILIRSKLWEMGLNIANLVLGNSAVKVHASIHEWEGVGAREAGVTFRRKPIALAHDAPSARS
jgi:hypothetical protein